MDSTPRIFSPPVAVDGRGAYPKTPFGVRTRVLDATGHWSAADLWCDIPGWDPSKYNATLEVYAVNGPARTLVASEAADTGLVARVRNAPCDRFEVELVASLRGEVIAPFPVAGTPTTQPMRVRLECWGTEPVGDGGAAASASEATETNTATLPLGAAAAPVNARLYGRDPAGSGTLRMVRVDANGDLMVTGAASLTGNGGAVHTAAAVTSIAATVVGLTGNARAYGYDVASGVSRPFVCDAAGWQHLLSGGVAALTNAALPTRSAGERTTLQVDVRGRLRTNALPAQSAAAAVSVVSVGAGGATIAASATRRRITIANPDATGTLHVGLSADTSATKWRNRLTPGEGVTIEGYMSAIYLQSATTIAAVVTDEPLE